MASVATETLPYDRVRLIGDLYGRRPVDNAIVPDQTIPGQIKAREVVQFRLDLSVNWIRNRALDLQITTPQK